MSITPDPTLTGQTPITFTYTNNGKRATMTDASGTTSWTYDARDRVKTKVTPQGTLTYTYQPNGLVASVVSSNANGVNISYSYDTLNRLQSVTDQAGTTNLTWDDAANPTSMTYPNGVVHTFSTDVTNRLNSVTLTKGQNTLGTFSYTYSNSGQKLSSTESGGRSTTWGYNAVYRLISENITPDGNVSYTHDAVGNRLTRTSTIPGLPNTTNTYDLNDRISGDTFDDNGNTLTSGGHTFAYDFLDRLTNYDNGGVTIMYDGDGNRVSKTVGGITTRYLVDDLTPTGYAQVGEELVNGSVIRRYTHGTLRINQTQSISGNWTIHYYGYDGGFHVRSLTDASGTVTDTYPYEAFGKLLVNTGTTPNLFLYRGEQNDPALGMYYLRARSYMPATGRFSTTDKVEGIDYAPDTAHAFNYGHANPIHNMDPEGTQAAIEWGLKTKQSIDLVKVLVRGAAVALGVAVVVGTWPHFPNSEVKVHAQGSDFGGNPRDAGTGKKVQQQSLGYYPRYMLMTNTIALESMLTPSEQKPRVKSFAALRKWIRDTWGQVVNAYFERSFQGDNDATPPCRRERDCRVDLHILKGALAPHP